MAIRSDEYTSQILVTAFESSLHAYFVQLLGLCHCHMIVGMRHANCAEVVARGGHNLDIQSRMVEQLSILTVVIQ